MRSSLLFLAVALLAAASLCTVAAEADGAGMDARDFGVAPAAAPSPSVSPVFEEEQEELYMDSSPDEQSKQSAVGGAGEASEATESGGEEGSSVASVDKDDTVGAEGSQQEGSEESSVKLGSGQKKATAMEPVSGSQADGVIRAASVAGDDGKFVVDKIVRQLTPNARQFTKSEGDSIPAYADVAEQDPERNAFDEKDSVMGDLYRAHAEVEGRMARNKKWIGDVESIVAHYREKIARVRGALRDDAIEVYKVKAQIKQRHEELRKERLRQSLYAVGNSVRNLQQTKEDVEQKVTSLVQVRESLHNNIRAIRDEIMRLKRQKFAVGV